MRNNISKSIEKKDDVWSEPTSSEFTDTLDVARFLASVHSRIKKDIKEDFVLASLDAKTKEYITEMTSNAYFSKIIYVPLLRKAVQDKIKWTRKLGKHSKEAKDAEYTIRMIIQDQKSSFDSFMNKLYMLALLSRNTKGNAILNLLGGHMEADNTRENEESTTNQFQRIMQMFQNQEGE